ncbi:MAG TPA: DUF4910 domain-containing protein [Thermoanaerobaculia bacterium]|nr:DUF4910 domain-containing protein [Thermoanaerobaculia bacterium]
MTRRLMLAIAVVGASAVLAEDLPPLLDGPTTRALSQEISGELAHRNLEELSRHHRMRGSDGFDRANDHIIAQLERYGLASELLRFPADGEIFYGTQRSRPPWFAEFAELWEIRDSGDIRIASWDVMPLRLAQDSESASVTAELVDVGPGTSDDDYAGRDVRGRLVLTSSQPEAVAELAVGRLGVAGILSYAQNQKSAWWKEDESLVRWGHLDTFSDVSTFGFMLSLQEARAFQERLAAGETITLRAEVRAGKKEGAYELVTSAIPGSDRNAREIVYSCHLDHPRPGANDNASGCVAILEIARTLSKLIDEKKLPRPQRTIRFVWPPEIEGTLAFLTGRPDIASRIDAAIHLDMVGGGPETKAIFHVTRGPASLPSFVYDVSQEIGRWVNRQTALLAKTGSSPFPLVELTGGKEPLQAEMVDLTMGSDHQIYAEGSFAIPTVYLNDWPDRYIHTTGDTAENVDATKLKRSAFIAAATGWVLANLDEEDVPRILPLLERNAFRRATGMLERREDLDSNEAALLHRFALAYEQDLVDSIGRFAPLDSAQRERSTRFLTSLSELLRDPAVPAATAAGAVYRRNEAVRGPMTAFGYAYLPDHYGAEKTRALRLLRMARGNEYAYEALNLVDGRRSVQEIRDILSAIYGPVPLDAVEEYLEALESIEVIRKEAVR